ncbi:APC family permease [Rivularia sp. UHCC 0363]|uniref:APC family permease n=1 Tax=Rivularia sp. UHCC 0363 TaxID=3110244 RepID=UPI002B1F64CD|nr:APC family permease [Rivularia sp. UHCC 0363]MEA5595975.1 APC family permease [Rivularia sp. UHCC 0363]
MKTHRGLWRYLVGEPLPTSAFAEERLTNTAALAVLSSDALSSVAYATEEILLVLVLAGGGALGLSLPIALGIALLLAIIALSYRQTIRAYPSGGGAYTVARENLGIYPGLIAAASLMIDYILTVTVSVSAGIAALTSAVPALQPFVVELCLLLVFLLMLANLRGLRSSGQLFSIPTYAFIVTIFGLIIWGIFRQATGQITVIPVTVTQTPISLFLLCRAFAAGCTALTGVEAISNGVMVFKSPEWQNARRTLGYMVGILTAMFLGITYLAHVYQIVPESGQTVLSLLGRSIFGNGIFYYFLQITTLLILMLAANTSFADFPRLSYFLARDRFLPRQLLLLGDRLVYSNGIILLSATAAILIVIFRGQTNAIIPLYAVGVFTSFSLSQAGMVRHWFKDKTGGWLLSTVINGIGAIMTTLVLMVIVATKFKQGAWIVVLAIPAVVYLFLSINRHYRIVRERLSIDGMELNRSRTQIQTNSTTPAIVLVGQLHRGTVEALEYARSIASQIVAIHVDIGDTDKTNLLQQWQELEADIPLIILDSPYRSVVKPMSEFVADFEARHPETFTTVIIPVFMTRHWWEDFLHNQTALFVRAALRNKRSRVISSVRYYL